ncbi:hypothetical protein [Fodinicurvata sp. EGI_FJ10296]|uniref:hypothetical protein n=1 Tax=Fodinicurvata sp. EGI_FJ10296 TaxID=3231908 RepID=UPI00345539BE
MKYVDLIGPGLGLVGVILLSFPAIYAEKYGRLLGRLNKLDKQRFSDAESEAHATALSALADHRDRWTRGKSLCLFAGLAMAVLSYFIALIERL